MITSAFLVFCRFLPPQVDLLKWSISFRICAYLFFPVLFVYLLRAWECSTCARACCCLRSRVCVWHTMCVRVFVCVCSLDSVGVLFGAVICCLFSLYHHDQITFSACALLFGVLCRFSLFFSRMYSLARVPLLLGCFQTPEANACVTCTSAQCTNVLRTHWKGKTVVNLIY